MHLISWANLLGDTPLAGERLRPLGHVSAYAYSRASHGNTRRNLAFAQESYLTRQPLETAPKGPELRGLWSRFGHRLKVVVLDLRPALGDLLKGDSSHFRGSGFVLHCLASASMGQI